MDENLAPLMLGLLAAFALGMGYIFFSAWQMQRRVAHNVVNAVLTVRQLKADQAAAFELGVSETMASFHLTPELLDRAEPCVRYAVYAEAMRRKQIAPYGDAKPFQFLRSPFLARSARTQIAVARIQAETQHSTVLSELDAVAPLKPKAARPVATLGHAERS